MKIFEAFHKNFEFFGLNSKKSRWNVKSIVSFCIYSLSSCSGIMFVIFKANTFLEYAMSIYILTANFATWFGFSVLLFQKDKLFKLIHKLEKFSDKSE